MARRLVSLVLFAFLTASGLAAPWQPIGPDGGAISMLAVDPTNPARIFAGNVRNGVFRSTDGGINWQPVFDARGNSVELTDLRVGPSGHVYAASNNGLWVSADQGLSWNRIGTDAGLPAGRISALEAAFGQTVLAALNQQIFISLTAGEFWGPLQSPEPLNLQNTITVIRQNPVEPSVIFVVSNNRLFRSLTEGNGWTLMADLPDIDRVEFNRNGSIVYAAGSQGIYRSFNSGENWQLINSVPGTLSMLDISEELLVGTADGVDRVTFFGREDSGAGLPGAAVRELVAASNLRVFAGTDAGVFRSEDGGRTWTASSAGLRNSRITALRASENRLFAATRDEGLLLRQNGVWVDRNGGLPRLLISTIEFVDEPGNIVLVGFLGGEGGIFRSDDGGVSWLDANLRFPIRDIAVDPFNRSVLYAGTVGAGLARSGNGGLSWPRLGAFPDMEVLSISVSETSVFASSGRLFRSTDEGQSWTLLGAGLAQDRVIEVVADPRSQTVFAATQFSGVYRSTNNGDNWTSVSGSLPATPGVPIRSLIMDPEGRLYVALNADFYQTPPSSLVFFSTNAGDTWTPVGDPNTLPRDVSALEANRTTVFAGTDSRGVYQHATPVPPPPPTLRRRAVRR